MPKLPELAESLGFSGKNGGRETVKLRKSG
jgi:hypothetical protein